jgi:hypothetical protein
MNYILITSIIIFLALSCYFFSKNNKTNLEEVEHLKDADVDDEFNPDENDCCRN